MARISAKFLTIHAERACKDAGLDFGPHYENRKAVVGRVALTKGMYGYDLEQIVNEGGGIRQLNGCANGLKAEAMLAFLDGMILAARTLKARA